MPINLGCKTNFVKQTFLVLHPPEAKVVQGLFLRKEEGDLQVFRFKDPH